LFLDEEAAATVERVDARAAVDREVAGASSNDVIVGVGVDLVAAARIR
jgi:hypothetical protein